MSKPETNNIPKLMKALSATKSSSNDHCPVFVRKIVKNIFIVQSFCVIMSSKIPRREFIRLLAGSGIGLIGLGSLGFLVPRKVYAPIAILPTPEEMERYQTSIFNGDFEGGLAGWNTNPGGAFDNQPILGNSITAAEVDPDMVAIGGDYWRNTKYHVGYSGDYLIKSIRGRAGLLWSDQFRIPTNAERVSFLIGGNLGRVKLQFLRTEDVEVFPESGGQSTILPAGEWYDALEPVYVPHHMILEERAIEFTSTHWGKIARVVVEQFPNQSGVILVDHFQVR